jgi:midasin (ATPase involved in ribosome maturation)
MIPGTRHSIELRLIASPKGLRNRLAEHLFDANPLEHIDKSLSYRLRHSSLRKSFAKKEVQIPVHRGQSFRRIADSIPVIADSFS